jgi:hypothetical protein
MTDEMSVVLSHSLTHTLSAGASAVSSRIFAAAVVPSHFRFARENEAVGVADAVAWVMSAVLIFANDLQVTRRSFL